MAKKFTQSVRHWLIENINLIIELPLQAFFNVTIDDVGRRFMRKNTVLNAIPFGLKTPAEIENYIVSLLVYTEIIDVNRGFLKILEHLMSGAQNTVEIVRSLEIINFVGDDVNMAVCSLLAPFIRSTFGSEMASENIKSGNTVNTEAIKWLEDGLNSDATSSRLKMASALYSSGDFITASLVLESIEKKYDQNIIESLCGCNIPRGCELSGEFQEMAGNKLIVDVLQNNIAFCVRFLPSEIHCVPHELQYEMFRRSTSDDIQHSDDNDKWMDMAVVDSLPYLYFLQYKTYMHLQRPDDQQGAFDKIISSILRTKNLGHKETAFNLLGQIMEETNRHLDAFIYYMKSLKIRQRNNVAIWHICRLLNSMVLREVMRNNHRVDFIQNMIHVQCLRFLSIK
jgi:tetratricopeptide (TPR) repeat protein